MKNLLLFLLIWFSVTVFSQNFAPIGATWYYTEYDNFSNDIDYIMLKSDKDTVINDTLCSKLITRHPLFSGFRAEVEFLTQINDTVFFFDTVFNKFQILYDFNAGVGSSWDVLIRSNPLEHIDTIRASVDSVGTVEANNISLKVLYVNYQRISEENGSFETLNSEIIELMGDVNYLFYWYYLTSDYLDYFAGNHSGGLRCYEDNHLGLFKNNYESPCDYMLVGINEEVNDNINIYPNPTSDMVYIDSDDLLNIQEVELLNSVGQVLFSQTECSSIYLTGYKPGYYFVRIKTYDEKQKVVKVIKL